jgi:cysteine desulfurase family protein (TIGR01976 family)
LAKTWSAGDEVVVTRTEHDANFTPWVLAARDAGATVRYADVRDDTTLDIDDLRSKISERTKLVAVGCASNATGTINPVREVCDAARAVGALSYVDAVHYAPHSLIDVSELGCDLLACSAYKFFGPHVGILWGRRDVLESTPAYKVRPAPDSLPGKWMTGTQNHEGIAGVLAAIDYLADLGRHVTGDERLDRRHALKNAFGQIQGRERQLTEQLLAGLAEMPEYRVWGISDDTRLDERMPTVSITHNRISPRDLATQLGKRGIFVWHGNYYAVPLTTALGLEPDGMVRLGIVHYNTASEIERLMRALSEISAGNAV